jgi:hypothetical protein
VNVGGGFFRYVPPTFVEDGGAPDLVGVLPFVFLDRQRAYGCPHGVCPRPDHGWATREDMGTAGPTSKFRAIGRGRDTTIAILD